MNQAQFSETCFFPALKASTKKPPVILWMFVWSDKEAIRWLLEKGTWAINPLIKLGDPFEPKFGSKSRS